MRPRSTTLGFLVALLTVACSTTASAATYAWDGTTGRLVITADAADEAVRVMSSTKPGVISACGDEHPDTCAEWPGATNVQIILTSPTQDVGLSRAAIDTAAGGLHVEISGIDHSQLRYTCSNQVATSTRACTVGGHGNGIDLTDDAQPDFTFSGGPLDKLLIETGAGNDTIDLRAFTFPIHPTRIKGDSQIDVEAGPGNDTIRTGATRDSVSGGIGNDIIELGAGKDSSSGGAGNDTLIGGPGNDSLTDQGVGNDKFGGGPGNDWINAESGNDRVTGGPGNDRIAHRRGSLWVDMGAGNDQVLHNFGPFTGFGGPGNDYFGVNYEGSTGRNARIDCGAGNDRVYAAYPHCINCERIAFPNTPVGA